MILGMTCALAMLSLWMDGGMLWWHHVHMRLSMDCGRCSGRRRRRCKGIVACIGSPRHLVLCMDQFIGPSSQTSWSEMGLEMLRQIVGPAETLPARGNGAFMRTLLSMSPHVTL